MTSVEEEKAKLEKVEANLFNYACDGLLFSYF